MKNLLCKLGVHDWEDLPPTPEIYKTFNKEILNYSATSYRISPVNRICLRCGKKEMWMDDFMLDKISRKRRKRELLK